MDRVTATVERLRDEFKKLTLLRQLGTWLQDSVARRLVSKDTDASASRSYRYLARQIEADLPAAKGGRTILISSPTSLSLCNEAMLMFSYFMHDELGCRILLIDGTFREGGVGAALGYDGTPGFLDLVYTNDYRLNEVILPTARRDISILPAGRIPANEPFPITQSRISDLFTEVASRFDYILLQQASIFEDTRYLLFAAKVDLVLVLVEEGGTLVDELDRSMSVFRDHQITNTRVIMSAPR